MNQRRVHRIFGLLMLLPLIAWASTGVIFLTKPGYDDAYQPLNVINYDLADPIEIKMQKGWKEIRIVKSVLGVHLLVNKGTGFKQYGLESLVSIGLPSTDQVRQLVGDAITSNAKRYGHIDRVEGLMVYTDTGVEIQLNWDDLSLRQKGNDRRVIETLYKIHYLQWTKWESVNKVLGVLGLFCLVSLIIAGLWTYLSNRPKSA